MNLDLRYKLFQILRPSYDSSNIKYFDSYKIMWLCLPLGKEYFAKRAFSKDLTEGVNTPHTFLNSICTNYFEPQGKVILLILQDNLES